jgi:hypothetical protein
VVQNEEEEEAPCLHLAVLEPADSKMPQLVRIAMKPWTTFTTQDYGKDPRKIATV